MRRPVLLLLAALAFSLSACGDTFVDPFVRDSSALSVYGVLEAGFANEPSTVQTLRIQSVRTNAEPPRSLDDPALSYRATVITVDSFTGDSLRWSERRTQFSDGTYGDLFSAQFRPRPGGTYTLVVRRDDGREATAELTIPMPLEGSVLQWEQRPPRQRVVERVAWDSFGLDGAEALVEMGCGINCGADILLDDVPVVQLADGRFVAEYDLSEARRLGCIENLPPPETMQPCPPLTLERVRVRARVLGPEWVGADDPTRTTIQNGYGFVGGATLVETIYTPSAASAAAAGFAGG